MSFDQILLRDPLKTLVWIRSGPATWKAGAWHAKIGVHEAFRSQLGNVVGSFYDSILDLRRLGIKWLEMTNIRMHKIQVLYIRVYFF